MEKKQTYMVPRIEIIAMQNEGTVMGTSGSADPGAFEPGGDWTQGGTTTRTRSNVQPAGPLQEFEDFINDILTVKK